MANNIIDVITEQYPFLTRAGKKLADYIFRHASDAQYLSISSLAENTGVSEASITRFCRSLNLAGYNDFKLELAKAVSVSDLGEPNDPTQAITSEESLESTFRKIHAASISSLNETLDFLDEKEIERAVNYLCSADRVFCLGQGGSMVTAMDAWSRFSTASSRFVHIEDSHMQSMAISLATSHDTILFFSYSGSTKDMEDVLLIAKGNHVPVILITHFPRCRAADFADVILQCGYNESPLQSGSIPAKVGQMFLIECLFYGFCKKNPELTTAARTATAEAITKKML